MFTIENGKRKLEIPQGFSLRPRLDDSDDLTELGEAIILYRLLGDEFVYNKTLGLYWYDGSRWKDGENEIRWALEELTEAQAVDQLVNEAQVKQEASIRREELNSQLSLVTKYSTDQERENIKKQVMEIAGKTARDELSSSRRYKAFIDQMRRKAKIDAVVALFETLVKQVNASEFDSDPLLVNLPGGTYDIRTGQTREHRPDDLITKIFLCDPSEDEEQLGIWEAFLERVQDGKPLTRIALQSLAGCIAVGKVYEEKLIIAKGEGGNGKSTFFNALMRVMSGTDGDSAQERGAYASSIDSSLLISDPKGNNAYKRFLKLHLRGLRLAVAGETEEHAHLDASTVKSICSTDDITAEVKHKQGTITFTPSHTVILYTNHLPDIDSTDDGIWDRISVFPFDDRIRNAEDEIKNYTDELVRKAGGALVKWIIDGAQMFYQDNFKLYESPEMLREKELYRERNDLLHAFIRDKCARKRGYSVGAEEFYQAYRGYCSETGREPRSRQFVRDYLAKAGIYRGARRAEGWQYSGIKLDDSGVLNDDGAQVSTV